MNKIRLLFNNYRDNNRYLKNKAELLGSLEGI